LHPGSVEARQGIPLALVRNISLSNKLVRAGRWERVVPIHGLEIPAEAICSNRESRCREL